MGTNYYLDENECKCCGRADKLHIGKLSHGWKFLFHIYPNIKSADEWMKYLKSSVWTIVTEYGEHLAFNEFKEIIESRTKYKSRTEDKLSGFTTDSKYDYLAEDFS